MPQVIVIDNNLRAGANMAGSSGIWATRQAEDQAARADEAQRVSQMQAVLQDQRYREHTAAVAATALAGQQNRFDVADGRNQNRIDVANVTQVGATQRNAANIAGRKDVNDDRLEAQWGIAGMKEDDDLYQNELNLKYKYDDLKARQGISAATAKATADYHAAADENKKNAAMDAYRHSLEMEAIRSNLKNVRMRRAAAMSSLRANAIATGTAVAPGALADASAPFDKEAAAEIKKLNDKAAEAMRQQQMQQYAAPAPVDLSGQFGDPGPAGVPGQAGPVGEGPVTVESEDHYQSLQPGTQYVAPDGTVRVKR